MKPAAVLLLFCALLGAQEAAAPIAPERLSNYAVVLVAPVKGAESMYIAIAPNGDLTFVPSSQTNAKNAEGYRPYTFGALRQALGDAIQANAALQAEVTRLHGQPPPQFVAVTPSQPTYTAEQIAAQRKAYEQQQKRALMLMYLMGQRPTTINLNVCDKTKAYCP